MTFQDCILAIRNPHFGRNVDGGYTSKLSSYAKNDGFADPIFPSQTLTRKISGHYILWPAIFSRFKISQYIVKWNDEFERCAYYKIIWFAVFKDFLPWSTVWANYRYDVNITSFWRFQKCWSIAESNTSALKSGNYDITNFGDPW